MSNESNGNETRPDRLKSDLRLNGNERVDVVLSLHGHFRNHVQFWHEQVFKAATWTIFAIYALVTYYVDQEDAARGSWEVVLALTILIGAFGFRYLYFCRNAYRGNWKQIVSCELALKLHEPGVYFQDFSFFDGDKTPDRARPQQAESGDANATTGLTWHQVEQTSGMHEDDINWVLYAHGVAVLAAVGIMLFVRLVAH